MHGIYATSRIEERGKYQVALGIYFANTMADRRRERQAGRSRPRAYRRISQLVREYFGYFAGEGRDPEMLVL